MLLPEEDRAVEVSTGEEAVREGVMENERGERRERAEQEQARGRGVTVGGI